jgi:hypothetical protein
VITLCADLVISLLGICEAVAGGRPSTFDEVDRAGLPSVGDDDGGGDAADLGTDPVVIVVRTELLSLGPVPRP